MDKNDNNSHINLEKLEKSIQQMIQKTLKSMEFKGHDSPYKRRPNVSRCPNNNTKLKNNTGTHNDSSHLNENGLSPRPKAHPLKNTIVKKGQNETYQHVCAVFREVVGLSKSKICNKDYFLVDTGSSWSLISNEIFDSVLGNRDFEDLQTTLTTDLCINEMEFSITVVSQLGDLSGILELDFLSKYKAVMNAGRLHSPFFGDIDLVEEDKLQSTCARIHITETVSIPAKCERKQGL